jgi:hypothetical protein
MLDAHRPFRNFVYTINGAGSPAYVQTSGKPIHDASGNFLGYRGTGTNITAKIRAGQLEEALQEAKVGRPVRIRSLPRHREGQWKGHAGQEPTLNLAVDLFGISGQSRVRFRSGRLWSLERHRRARCGKPAVLFLSANTARHPAGICAGIGSNRRQKCLQIQMVMVLDNYRPGAPSCHPPSSAGVHIRQ